MKKILSAVLVATIFLSLGGCSKEVQMLITSQTSPAGEYKVLLYQVGEPIWSFGSVTAKLVLEDAEGKVLDTEQFELNNDGGGVDSSNIVSSTHTIVHLHLVYRRILTPFVQIHVYGM